MLIKSPFMLKEVYSVYPFTIFWIGNTQEFDTNYDRFRQLCEKISDIPKIKILYADKNDFENTKSFSYDTKGFFALYIYEQGGMRYQYPEKILNINKAISFISKIMASNHTGGTSKLQKCIIPPLDVETYQQHYLNSGSFVLISHSANKTEKENQNLN